MFHCHAFRSACYILFADVHSLRNALSLCRSLTTLSILLPYLTALGTVTSSVLCTIGCHTHFRFPLLCVRVKFELRCKLWRAMLERRFLRISNYRKHINIPGGKQGSNTVVETVVKLLKI